MSTIKVNNIENRTGSSITIGGSSTTSLNLASTITGGTLTNTPAFEAYLSSNQSFNDNVLTKVQFDTEVFDSDGCYDNSTNYRFTPTVAGKYYVYSLVELDVTDLTNKLYTSVISIYKNGSSYKIQDNFFDFSGTTGIDIYTEKVYTTIDMNGSTDYIEIYAKANGDQNGEFRSGGRETTFGAYRLIGL